MTSAKPHWADAIKRRRQELKLSQEELALRADVSPSLITKLERGAHDIKKMKLENYIALLRALQWTPQEFAEATGVEVPGASVESLGAATTPSSYERVAAPDNEFIRWQDLSDADIDYKILEDFLWKITPKEREQIEQALEVVENVEKYLNEEVKGGIGVLEWVAREVLKLFKKSTANEGAG